MRYRGLGSLRYLGFLAVLLPVGVLLVLVVYPLATIVVQSVMPDLFSRTPSFALSLDPIQRVFSDPGSYRAISFSFGLATVVALGCACLGTSLAILTARTDMPGRQVVDLMVWVIFFTPSFLFGEAWTILMLRGGTIDQLVHLPDGLINTFFSPVGVSLLLIFKNFPFVYISVRAALAWLGSDFADAAAVSGARPLQAWRRINLPLLGPAIVAGALIVFAEVLGDFGTAATIAQNAHIPLVSYQIYEAIGTFPSDFALAGGLSLLLFAAIVVALAGQAGVQRARSFQVITGRTRPARRMELGQWRWAATGFLSVVALLGLLLPLAECVLLSFQHAFGNGLHTTNLTLLNYRTVLATGGDDLASLGTSARLAVAAATAVTVIGLPVAYMIRRTQLPGRRLLGVTTLVTISVPGIILACGYIFAWNSPYLRNVGIGGRGQIHFYGTIWILLAAYIGGALPLAIRLNIGALEQIGTSLIEAARIQGASVFHVLISVVAPILRSSLVSIWLLVFTGTIFELAASELLYPPGEPTMPVRITAYFGVFRIETGMALAMLNVALVAVAVMLLRYLPRLAAGVSTLVGRTWSWRSQLAVTDA